MCGVFACFLNRPLDDRDISLGREGTDKLTHRGPDGSGEWIDRENGVFLGHRRLAVIDLSSASAQPMSYDRFTISYNGELYNFPEIRTELKAGGYSFETTGDVEVLLKAWSAWGSRSLDKFDGMFAFVIWDGQRAHVATDAFGEKPLYLARTDDGIYLSSEIDPLAKLLGFEPDLKDDDLLAYLSLGFIPPPATGYSEIERISAGQYLTIRHGVVASKSTYWSFEPGQPGKGPVVPISEQGLDRIQEALVESIQRRLQADAPLCMFLSRGVDSALVAALAKKECAAQPQCLTVSYPNGTSVDEAPAARAIANHLGLEHTVIQTPIDLQGITPASVLEIYGQPCETVSSISIRNMSKAAVDQGYKVALTGMGGDEVFFGYGKSSYFYQRRKIYALPQGLRMLAGRLASPFSSYASKLQTVACDLGVADNERFLARKNFPAIEGLRQLPGFSEFCRTWDTEDLPIELWYPAYEMREVMPGLRLVTFDHSSMRSSLELRTPFLSRDLLDVVAEFDPRALMAFGQKNVLKRLLSRYLTKEMMDFPKSGFVFPQDLYVQKFGEQCPDISSIPKANLENIWRARHRGKGWTRLAIRLINLECFYRTRVCDDA